MKRITYNLPALGRGKMKVPKHPPRKLPKVLRDALKAKAREQTAQIYDDDELVRPTGSGRDGVPGRKIGRGRGMSTMLKDAVLFAAKDVGEDGTGLGGLVGYLKYLAMLYPEEFVVLLRAVLPLEISSNNNHNVRITVRTAEEVQKELAERGIVLDGFLE